ncbi:ABC transporter permease [Lachnoclostridium sp. An14]|uniref:ABC transporter permease n=1 Tax=Lachnoclostridium sp. An14 TaxID=1965562 RepID=UPI000B3A09DD|nr:ABC transporter permease [Lachnoclostridium sp. An14]OUQ17013.1 ABC transporter permease [Lachnoclostridium sp. An14]
MMALLVFRERLRVLYGKYAAYIDTAVRFLISFSALMAVSESVGFMTRLSGPVPALVLAFLCAFLPYGLDAVIVGAFTLAHISVVSLEIAVLLAVAMLLIMLLYYGFQPGDSWLLLVTPLAFFLNVPYAVPLLAGLSCSLVSVIPACSGVFFYYMIIYVRQNAGTLTGSAAVDIAEKYSSIFGNVASNEMMIAMMAAFAVGILTVYFIRNRSIDYAWYIAIAAGMVVQAAIVFIGGFAFNVPFSIVQFLVGTVFSVALALIYNFLVFAVDYSRTEYLQYEDDDYYYYVKAVPKIAVSAPDIKVQRINARKGGKKHVRQYEE